MVYALPPVTPTSLVVPSGNYTPQIVDDNDQDDIVLAPSLGISAKVKVETKSVVTGHDRYYHWRRGGLLDNLGNTLSDLGDAI